MPRTSIRMKYVHEVVNYLINIGYLRSKPSWIDPTVNGYRVKLWIPDTDKRVGAMNELKSILTKGGFNYEVKYMGMSHGGCPTRRTERPWLCIIVPYGG